MGQGRGKKPATYEDIEALPVGWVGELIEEELVASPRPATRHLRVASRLGMLLGISFELGQEGPGGWWFLDEPELHFGGNVLVPDLAGWRRDRVPVPPEAPWLTIAPDWICEVLSPSTWAVDRVRKMPLYQREGVGHAWLIDPLRHTLEVYRAGEGSWRRTQLFEGDGTVWAEPFDSAPLEMGLLWLPGHPERKGSPSP